MRGWLVFAILTLTSVATAHSQGRPNTRRGLWFGFGVGTGSSAFDCATYCTTDRVSAPTGYFRIGGTLSPSILLGGEVNSWINSENGVDESMSFASVVLLWYPGG